MFIKLTIVLIALAIFSVNTAPVDQPQTATILKYSYEPNENHDGGYKLEYETSDGQIRRETGTLTYVGDENIPVLSVNGLYSYVGPDGVTYTVTYLADQNGFSPYGEHLPGVNQGSSTDGQPPVLPPLALPPNAINSLIG